MPVVFFGGETNGFHPCDPAFKEGLCTSPGNGTGPWVVVGKPFGRSSLSRAVCIQRKLVNSLTFGNTWDFSFKKKIRK